MMMLSPNNCEPDKSAKIELMKVQTKTAMYKNTKIEKYQNYLSLSIL